MSANQSSAGTFENILKLARTDALDITGGFTWSPTRLTLQYQDFRGFDIINEAESDKGFNPELCDGSTSEFNSTECNQHVSVTEVVETNNIDPTMRDKKKKKKKLKGKPKVEMCNQEIQTMSNIDADALDAEAGRVWYQPEHVTRPGGRHMRAQAPFEPNSPFITVSRELLAQITAEDCEEHQKLITEKYHQLQEEYTADLEKLNTKVPTY